MKTLACRLVLLLALLLHVPAALALGLGQIEVKSQAGEPLLAEIPIVTADPSELDNLQARLASPETFRRIGLEPPTGLVSGLRFTIALDPRGRPVIRITSDVPVQQPLLTFLIEVDWGQGRLVREYSALVDTPQTVAAPAQPPIQAPDAAPSNVIARTPQAGRDAEDARPDDVPAAEAEPEQAVAEESAPPAPASVPPASAAPAATAAAPGEYGPVQQGQTLGRIAAELSAGSGQSLNQVMLTLLRANPEAFIGGNLNLIRQGAVLRVPPQDDWSQASVAEANALVREHVARWREMRRPVARPEADAGAAQAAAPDAAASPPSAAEPAARVADARLEIVPAGSGGQEQAGTRTGAAAGGEGDMLQQQDLTQTRETLAARDAEVRELQTRLAELEQLQQQQQQLIQMKDSELAAAQERLAQSNAQASQPQPDAQGAATAGLPWLWIGLGLLVAGLLAWWLRSRRKPVEAARKPAYGFASAPGQRVPGAAVSAPRAPDPEPQPAAPVAEVAPSPAPAVETQVPMQAAVSWRAAPAAATGGSPTWHAGSDAATVAPLNQAPAGQERIELARAYIDLGDVETARSLLQEVAASGDADARGEAERLLRDLA